MNKRKLLRKVLSGSKNLRFADIMALAQAFGFRLARVSGSHHINIFYSDEDQGYIADLIRQLKDAPDHAVLRVVREVRDGNW